jgi:hypothetical protein
MRTFVGFGVSRRFFQHDVGVGSPKTEGTDPGQGRAGGPGPWPRMLLNSQSKLIERNMGIGFPEMQTWRDNSMFKGECNLDQTGNAGCCLQVPDIGFDGTDDASVPGGTIFGEHGSQGFRFDRITQCRACTVGLYGLDLVR